MYTAILPMHSYLRWAVLLTALIAIARALRGWRNNRPWTLTDGRAGFWFSLTLDLQFLLGIVLYFFLSPITTAALADFGGAMRDASLRFWAVEHVAGMVIAIALVHIGAARVAKSSIDSKRHKLAFVFYSLALVVILLSIPWPFMAQGRPLFS